MGTNINECPRHIVKGTVEALAKIFDFVAGLMQKIPKKPTKGKADWSNLTANLGLSPMKREKVLQMTRTHRTRGKN